MTQTNSKGLVVSIPLREKLKLIDEIEKLIFKGKTENSYCIFTASDIVDLLEVKGLLTHPNFELSEEDKKAIRDKVITPKNHDEWLDDKFMEETAKYLAERNFKLGNCRALSRVSAEKPCVHNGNGCGESLDPMSAGSTPATTAQILEEIKMELKREYDIPAEDTWEGGYSNGLRQALYLIDDALKRYKLEENKEMILTVPKIGPITKIQDAQKEPAESFVLRKHFAGGLITKGLFELSEEEIRSILQYADDIEFPAHFSDIAKETAKYLAERNSKLGNCCEAESAFQAHPKSVSGRSNEGSTPSTTAQKSTDTQEYIKESYDPENRYDYEFKESEEGGKA